MNNCSDTSFHDFLSHCEDTIDVYALLQPGTQYDVVITDKFDKQYKSTKITDANGFLELDVDDYPAGLFNPHVGDLKMEIFTSDCQKVSFRITKYYDSIKFDIKAGTRVKDNLGCEFECVDGTIGQGSAIFPFTADATTTIPWNSFLQGLYGNVPTVQVYHEDENNEFHLVTVDIELVGGVYDLTSIEIDHGGPANGFVIVN